MSDNIADDVARYTQNNQTLMPEFKSADLHTASPTESNEAYNEEPRLYVPAPRTGSPYQRLINGVEMSSKEDEFFRANLATDNTMPQMLPRPRLNQAVYKPVLFSDQKARDLVRSAYEEPELPLIATPEEQVGYLVQKGKQRKARASLALVQTKLSRMGVSGDIQEQALALGLDPNRDPAELEAILAHAGWGMFNDLMLKYGEIPEDIALDPAFMQFATPETMGYIQALHELKRDNFDDLGWTDQIANANAYVSKAQELASKYNNLDISLEEKEAEEAKLAWRLHDDGSLFKLSSLASGMLHALTTEEGLILIGTGAATGAAIGSVASPFGALAGGIAGGLRGAFTYGVPAAFALDTFSQTRADSASQVQRLRGDNSRKAQIEALNGTGVVLSSIGAAALDVVGLGVGMRTVGAPLLKLMERSGSTLGSKLNRGFTTVKQTQAKAGVKDAAQQAVKREQMLRDNLTLTFKPIAESYASEVTTEGLQGAVQQVGINADSGQSGGVGKAFWDNAAEAAEVMMYLSPLAGARGVRTTVRDLYSITKDISKQATATAEDTLASDNDLNRAGNENKSSEVLFRTYASNNVYFSIDRLIQLRDSGQIDFDLIDDPRFHNLEEQRKNGVFVAIDKSTWDSKFANKDEYAALKAIKRPDPATRSGEELVEAVRNRMQNSQWRAEHIDAPIAERMQFEEDLSTIQQDLFVKLNESETLRDIETTQLVIGQITNFIEGIHEAVPSLSIMDIYNEIRPNVKERVLDTRRGSTQDEPSFDIADFSFNFDRNASLATVEHELGHFYFESLHRINNMVRKREAHTKGLVPQREALNKIIKSLADWGGYADYNKLSPEAKRSVHENFAIGMTRSIISGQVDAKNYKEFMRFRTFLVRALRNEMRERMTPEQLQADRANFLASRNAAEMTPELEREYLMGYLDRERKASSQRFGFKEIKRHRQLDKLIDKLILSQNKREEFEQQFPLFDDLLRRIRVNLTDPEDIAVIEQLEEDNRYLRAATQSAFDGIMTVTGEVLAKGYKKINNTIEELKKFPNYRSIPRFRLYQAFIKARGLSEFKEAYRKAYNVARNDYLNQQYSDIIQGNKLAKDDVLSYISSQTPLYRTLRERGLIAEQGGLPLSVRANSPQFKPDLYPHIAYDKGKSREVMFLEGLATHDNTRRQALNATMMQMFERPEMVESVEAIINDIQERAMQVGTRRRVLKDTVAMLKKLMGKAGIDPNTPRHPLEVSPESFANTMIDNMCYADLKPMNIQRQSTYYQHQALSALEKDDLQSAALYLEQAEYLTATTGKAMTRRTRLINRIKALRTKLAKSNKDLGKNYDPERIAIARALMARVGLFPSGALRDARYIVNQFGSQSQKEDLRNLLNDNSYAAFYSNMNVRALESVLDAVEEQVALAKEDHDDILKQMGIAKEDAREEMIAAAEKLKPQTDSTVLADGTAGTDLTFWSKVRAAPYNAFQRYLLKPLQLFQALDRAAGKPVFEKYFYRPFRETESLIKNTLYAYRAEMIGVFADTDFKAGTYTCSFLKVIKPESRGKKPEDMTEADYIPLTLGATGRYKGRASIEALSLVLHMGNESNFKKLCGGYNVTKEEFMEEFNRLWEEGYINKSIITAANKIWARNQKIFIEAQKAHRKCHGFYAHELEARPIICPDGTVATGGYVPALTNALHHNFEHIATDIDQMLSLMDFNRTNITKEQNERWAQERAENFAQPLSLDPEALLAQNERLIRYSYNAPMAMALVKLVEGHSPEAQQLQALLYRYNRDLWGRIIVPWLGERVHGISNPVLSHPVVRFLNTLVRQTGAAIMCANISNSIQQYSGIITAMSIIPPSKLYQAMTMQLGAHDEFIKTIELSNFMKTRLAERQISIEQSFHNIMIDPDKLEGWQKIKGTVIKAGDFNIQHAYFLQKIFQNDIDRKVWYAAYRDAVDNHGMEEKSKDAIAWADNAVIKTQTSYDDMDKNFMEKTSPLARALTMFGSYSWSMANLIYGEWVRTGALPPNERYKRRAWVIISTFTLPTIFADLVNKVISRQSIDSDDDDTFMQGFFMDNLIGSQIRFGLGMVPFFGQLAAAAYNSAIGNSFYTDTRFNSPVFTTLDALTSSAKKFLTPDDEIKYSDIRNVATGFAAITPFAFAAPFGRSAGYLFGVARDQIDPTGGFDFVVGALTGKVSEDSKN